MRQVRASICKFEKRKSPYRVRWKPSNAKNYKTEWKGTKKEANQRKQEIEEYENGNRDLSKELDFQEIREAQIKLKHTLNERAKGKSISYAVDWFLENFQGGDEILELKSYFKEYIKLKSRIVSKHTIDSDQQLIGTKGKDGFINLFGNKKPTECTREFLQKYLDEKGSKFHRGKSLKAFFRWLCGESKYHNDTPCLRKDPTKGLYLAQVNKDQVKAVATNQEICDLLYLSNSKKYNYSAAFWAFMFFTGLRPSECIRFWASKKCGWNQIHLDDQEPYIYIPADIIRKRGIGSRKIMIRKGFMNILKAFRDEGESKYPLKKVRNWKRVHSLVRKEIWGKRLTISSAKDEVKDITRHTFVTNLHLYADSISVLTNESGTSDKTLREHYINSKVFKRDSEYFFENIDISNFKQKVSIKKPKIRNTTDTWKQLISLHGTQMLWEVDSKTLKKKTFPQVSTSDGDRGNKFTRQIITTAVKNMTKRMRDSGKRPPSS